MTGTNKTTRDNQLIPSCYYLSNSAKLCNRRNIIYDDIWCIYYVIVYIIYILWLGQFPLMFQGKIHHLVPQLNPTTASASHSTDGLQIRTWQLPRSDKRHWYFWYVWIRYQYWSRFTEVLYQFIIPADPSRVGEWWKAYEKLRGRCSSAQPAASVGGFDKQFLLCLQFLISTLQLLRGADLWWHRFKGSWETEMHNRNDSWVWFNMFKSETVRSIQHTYI